MAARRAPRSGSPAARKATKGSRSTGAQPDGPEELKDRFADAKDSAGRFLACATRALTALFRAAGGRPIAYSYPGNSCLGVVTDNPLLLIAESSLVIMRAWQTEPKRGIAAARRVLELLQGVNVVVLHDGEVGAGLTTVVYLPHLPPPEGEETATLVPIAGSGSQQSDPKPN